MGCLNMRMFICLFLKEEEDQEPFIMKNQKVEDVASSDILLSFMFTGDDSTHAIQHGQFLYGFSNI